MKKKTQKIIAIGLATALVGSSVIVPCARAFATPNVIYTCLLYTSDAADE